ncbi:MAG: molybdopterin-dependent oxidoreductase [Anaerolineales bacterium]|nr:molybdopterin-dependent oxidoreductase [Anaerolineales bacterium]MCB8990477.1 molybdopterin-dependent oxidoreductase [Ardenticatenaceae bacterium]MCB9003491.1 molybdopterin-dependent oxidoreductase [Ardenticatenaceae bacterium]
MDEFDPLRPHSHEPNMDVPPGDGSFVVRVGNGRSHTMTPADLHTFPQTTVENCFIVSTGHGTSGPFAFTGVRLLDMIMRFISADWSQVAVISRDGFGNRIMRTELESTGEVGPILLAYARDGNLLTRAQGLVRLIVPSERDDALRQVKWVEEIAVY